MSSILVRNLEPEIHRALKARAAAHGRSVAAEARAILDAALRPANRLRLGSALAAIGRAAGGLDLDLTRDKTPAEPVDLK